MNTTYVSDSIHEFVDQLVVDLNEEYGDLNNLGDRRLVAFIVKHAAEECARIAEQNYASANAIRGWVTSDDAMRGESE
jgi:hypothetical protein